MPCNLIIIVLTVMPLDRSIEINALFALSQSVSGPFSGIYPPRQVSVEYLVSRTNDFGTISGK